MKGKAQFFMVRLFQFSLCSSYSLLFPIISGLHLRAMQIGIGIPRRGRPRLLFANGVVGGSI
jgi:hypothetical protein